MKICQIFGITLNNKIVELQHQFQRAGISMYSMDTSFLGDAIISDLIDYAQRGTQNLDDYSKELKKLTESKTKQEQSLEKTSPVRRLWGRIPQLQQALIEEYKKDLPNQGSFRANIQEYLYVPDFSGETQKSRENEDGQRENVIPNENTSLEDEEK